MFFNVKESDGKLIDAQVDQMTNVIMRMSGDILYENRDEMVKRYIYSDEKLEDWKYIKYKNLYGNLWEKEIMLVKPKHRDMGLDKIKRMYIEI